MQGRFTRHREAGNRSTANRARPHRSLWDIGRSTTGTTGAMVFGRYLALTGMFAPVEYPPRGTVVELLQLHRLSHTSENSS